MKKLIEVNVPDGFDVAEDQKGNGYSGQSIIVIKLKPITEETINREQENRKEIEEQMKNFSNK